MVLLCFPTLVLVQVPSPPPAPPPPPWTGEMDPCLSAYDGTGIDCGAQLLGLGYVVLGEFGHLVPSRFGGQCLSTKAAMRAAGWVTNFVNLEHPAFSRQLEGQVQFFTGNNADGGYGASSASLYHRLPRGQLDVLVAACAGVNNACSINITSDAGAEIHHMPACSLQAPGAYNVVHKYSVDTSGSDENFIDIYERGGSACEVAYVLVKQTGTVPTPAPPPPPADPANTFCGDAACAAILLADGWIVLTEFGTIERFGASPGNPPLFASNNMATHYVALQQAKEACWAVRMNAVNNPYFTTLTNVTTSFFANTVLYTPEDYSQQTLPSSIATLPAANGFISHALPTDGPYELLVAWAGSSTATTQCASAPCPHTHPDPHARVPSPRDATCAPPSTSHHASHAPPPPTASLYCLPTTCGLACPRPLRDRHAPRGRRRGYDGLPVL